ncbi:MFS transporter [Glaciimonas soli]|uniref:MFS transporter n=1 Tax=Glaciimonas soli TaxID=2590999 RepID=A0A843YIM6_9BURK|nr:MFS transporter [Glaciimonas soli]MQQ99628.1 MFS transporter [Glaciimonas soli]
MSEQRQIDVQNFIDEKSFSGYQILIFIFCFLIVAADGLDTVILGPLVPALMHDWGVTRMELAPVFTAALIGLAIGSMGGGILADKFGRRKVLIVSVFMFSIFSLASAFAGGVVEMTLLRFLTGIGLGAAMSNAVTLMSEYTPQRIRSRIVNTVFMGFVVGAWAGGYLAAWLVPHFGWHSLFYVGGLVPLALSFAMFLLPESPRFMVVQNWPQKKIARVLNKISPNSVTVNDKFTIVLPPQVDGKSALSVIFSEKYLFGTICLWITLFMGMVIFYFVTSWMPVIVKDAGFTLADGAKIMALYPLGGLIGGIVVGYFMDKFNPHKAIAASYLLGAIFIGAIGFGFHDLTVLSSLVFVAGMFMSSAQGSMPTLAAAFYPTVGRATGVSWMLGISRLGSILGAAGGSLVLGLGLSLNVVFILLAIPGVIAAIALMFKGGHMHRQQELLKQQTQAA